MKRRTAGALFFLVLLLAMPGRGWASEPDEGDDWKRELSSYDFSGMEAILSETLGGEKISFGQVVGQLAEGNFDEFIRLFLLYADEALFGAVRTGAGLAWQVLLLAFAGALFANLGQAFPESQVSQAGFYAMYVVLAALLLTAFTTAAEVALEAFQRIGRLMTAFLPVFFLAVAVQGQLTAAAMYETTLLVIRGAQWLYERAVIPGIRFCVLLRLVQGVSQEDFISRLTKLLEKTVKWCVKTAFALVVGFQAVQALLLPYMDAVKGGALMKLARAIPGIGNSVEAAAQMALGTAALIRNGIGLAGLLALALISLGPLIKLGFIAVLYQGLAAVLQPVSDKRLLAAVGAVGEGAALLFKTMTNGILLFAIAVGIACACFGRVG